MEETNEQNVKYPDIEVRLIGEDSNAYAILGRVKRALKKNGVSDEEISEFFKEATSGDYDHLLGIVQKWVNVC